MDWEWDWDLPWPWSSWEVSGNFWETEVCSTSASIPKIIPRLLFVLAPGAFIVLGYLIAIAQKINKAKN